MKKQFLTAALALTVVSCGILASEAAPAKADEVRNPKMPPRKEMRQKPTPEQMKAMMEKRVEEFNKALNLSDSQIQKAKDLRAEGHSKMKPLMDKKKAKMDEIRAVMGNDNIKIKEQDRRIDALRADIKEIDQEIRQLRQDYEKAFKGILNDEQKAKYQQIKEEGRRHYRMHHAPQGPEAFRGPKGPHHKGYGPKPAPDAEIQPIVKPVVEK